MAEVSVVHTTLLPTTPTATLPRKPMQKVRSKPSISGVDCFRTKTTRTSMRLGLCAIASSRSRHNPAKFPTQDVHMSELVRSYRDTATCLGVVKFQTRCQHLKFPAATGSWHLHVLRWRWASLHAEICCCTSSKVHLYVRKSSARACCNSRHEPTEPFALQSAQVAACKRAGTPGKSWKQHGLMLGRAFSGFPFCSESLKPGS